jgi:acyl carrier protein
MSGTAVGMSVTRIRDWLLERVAFYLELPPERVRPDQELAEIGLDSVFALSLCGDVEERFGLLVEPTMAWDHPTVNAIAEHLSEELGKR